MSRTALGALSLGTLSLSILLGGAAELRAQGSRSGIISTQAARRLGLERSWVAQVELDQGRGRITYVTLHDGLLLVQTDQAALHALDAETRRTLWIAHVGSPGYATTAPAISDKFVASTNGGDLFLLERATGRVLWKRYTRSVPVGGPALGAERVYVPLVSGMVSSYRLPLPGDEETPLEKMFKDTAMNYQGKGISYSPPLVTHSSLVFATDAGNVYACALDTMTALFRFKTHDAISAPLAYRTPYIFAASRDGYLYCLRDPSGRPRWQFSVGSPLAEKPIAIGDALFVIRETGGMYRLNVNSGAQEWYVPGVFKFISGSPTRLYTADSSGRMLILDARNGARLGTLATEYLPIKVLNDETDRIYLGTKSGMIQCLREIELAEPFVHGTVGPPLDTPEEPAAGDGKPAAEKPQTPAANDNNPFGDEPEIKDEDMPAEDEKEEMPADGEKEEMPAEGEEKDSQ